VSDYDDFFALPDSTPTTSNGRHSVLQLLRREIQDCLVGEPIAEDDLIELLADPSRHDRIRRLFAATMVMLAGIDLLGKFYAGDDAMKHNAIDKRFRAFVNACMYKDRHPRNGAAGALWRVRNALMHSFSLYDIGAEADILLTTDLPADLPIVGVREKAKVWEVSIPLLYRDFVRSIREYQAQLQSDDGQQLQANFAKMYPHYGSIEGSW
jgi:hypothetical protein